MSRNKRQLISYLSSVACPRLRAGAARSQSNPVIPAAWLNATSYNYFISAARIMRRGVVLVWRRDGGWKGRGGARGPAKWRTVLSESYGLFAFWRDGIWISGMDVTWREWPCKLLIWTLLRGFTYRGFYAWTSVELHCAFLACIVLICQIYSALLFHMSFLLRFLISWVLRKIKIICEWIALSTAAEVWISIRKKSLL